MKRKFALLLLFLTLFASCGKSARNGFDQSLKVSIASEPATLDPRKGGDLTSSIFHFLLYEGLYRLENDGTCSPALAERVEISKDRTHYLFHIKEAYWSDGSAITAWDFEKSWKDILNPDFPSVNSHLLYPILNAYEASIGETGLINVGIHAMDANRLAITLKQPTPHFIELLAFCAFFPVNIDREFDEEHVGSGPFLLDRWNHNQEIVLKKNPYFHKADEIPLEKIRFKIVNDEMAAIIMYEKGQIDYLGHPFSHLPPDAIPTLKDHEDFSSFPAPATTFATFNVESYPFNNRHIRRAFALAIDRKKLVDEVTQIGEIPALSVIPPMLVKGEERAFFKDADIEQAKREFRVGLKELELTLHTFPTIIYAHADSEVDQRVAQVMQDYWFNAFGIIVELEPMQKNVLVHKLKTGTFQIAQGAWMAQYLDPMNFFERYRSKDNEKNYPKWSNEFFSHLLLAYEHAQSVEEKEHILFEAERIFLYDMPLTPLYHQTSARLAKPYLKKHILLPYGSLSEKASK